MAIAVEMWQCRLPDRLPACLILQAPPSAASTPWPHWQCWQMWRWAARTARTARILPSEALAGSWPCLPRCCVLRLSSAIHCAPQIVCLRLTLHLPPSDTQPPCRPPGCCTTLCSESLSSTSEWHGAAGSRPRGAGPRIVCPTLPPLFTPAPAPAPSQPHPSACSAVAIVLFRSMTEFYDRPFGFGTLPGEPPFTCSCQNCCRSPPSSPLLLLTPVHFCCCCCCTALPCRSRAAALLRARAGLLADWCGRGAGLRIRAQAAGSPGPPSGSSSSLHSFHILRWRGSRSSRRWQG